MIRRIVNILHRRPWAVAGALVLVGALAVTAAGRWYALHGVEQRTAAKQHAAVEQALATVEKQFARLRDAVHAQAQQVAVDSVVVNRLAKIQASGERRARLVQHVANLSLPARVSVEVYDSTLQLLAWKGPYVPRNDALEADDIRGGTRSAIAQDGGARHALVVWVPVLKDGRQVGAVRAVRMLREEPPVQNRHIRAYDVGEQWEEATGESIRVRWGERALSTEGETNRLLRGPDGHLLGRASVTPPSPERLRRRTARFYNDILAGWAALLLGWLVGVVGQWYLRLARRPGVGRLPTARTAATARFAAGALLWIGARYALLALDIPGRWGDQVSFLAPLFDPTWLASTVGGGIFRSIGEAFLTSVWAVGLAVGGVHLAWRYRFRASSVRDLVERVQEQPAERPSPVRFLGVIGGGLGLLLAMTVALAFTVRRVVLDSTLDFFSRTGLLPDPLVLVVLCSLFLLVVAVVLAGVALGWMGLRHAVRYYPHEWPWELVTFGAVVLVILEGAGLYLGTSVDRLVPFAYAVGMVGGVASGVVYGLVGRSGGADVLTARGHLVCLFVGVLLLYPLLYAGMDAQRRERMVEAARSFEEGYDPRVLYAIQQVLRTAEEELKPTLKVASSQSSRRIDSVAARLTRQSLLASLTSYEMGLSLLTPDGTIAHRYTATGLQARPARATPDDRTAFEALRRLHVRQPTPGPITDRFPIDLGEAREGGPYQYAGLLGVRQATGEIAYWVLLRANPRSLLPGTGSGVPRVLLPDGSLSDLYAELSLAEFRAGTLVRSFGSGFGRTQLPGSLEERLADDTALWRYETVRDRPFLTYYHPGSEAPDAERATVAVRIPAVLAFDHLYYLLRLTVAGLGIGAVFYLLGLYGRYRSGLLPMRRLRFRDKVLNAFLAVGVVSMGAVGVVGVRVVTSENERLVERQLREQLTRVEETLALEARRGEALWEVGQRMDVDSLAARVGLDIRLYEAGQLSATSRPRLVRNGLVDARMPGEAYHTLHEERYRFAVAEASIGAFRYRVGYQALSDADGRPRLVVGVPTLAQQEQVKQEQTRTLAYLFGALLVLVVMVMLTAVVLANALARPIARLREGLEAVGEGRFSRPLTVDTRDEIGDLVRTFNDMREQLAESRRKLAQQERELAWREMARQVAHEIKNPLTPMKLSIQHLRRTFQKEQPAGEASPFREAFDRITETLIEQIESLVRIADEFSTFARLPTRVPEPLDLNEVIREAVRLMREEEGADQIHLDLTEDPLVVEADREELRRIYINLLKNALQAIPEDREGWVQVTTATAENGDMKTAHSRVVDNGTGIPPELREKVFEPNFSTKTSGTGLGLAVARKAVDDLGGEIGFETTDGDGTTFWVRLPLAEEQS